MVEIVLATPGGQLMETVEEKPRFETENQRAMVTPRIRRAKAELMAQATVVEVGIRRTAADLEQQDQGGSGGKEESD